MTPPHLDKSRGVARRLSEAAASRPWVSRRTLLLGAAWVGAMTLGLSRRADAQLRIDVTQGTVQPLPIAIPDFIGGAPSDSDAARNISGIITSNLRRSGLFAPIDPAAYLEKITSIDAVPRFADWR